MRFNRNRRQFEWCEPKGFRLTNSGRPRVSYRYPSDRAILVTAHPTLDWAPIGRKNRYRIQIAADSLFSMPVVDVETEMSEYRTDLANGEYWWRTSYILENNEWSSWSESNSFELQEGWQPLTPIPVEVNAGGALCFNHFYKPDHPAHNSESLYAFVGGNNTRFYYYAPGRNVWIQETRDGTRRGQINGSSITSGGSGRVLLAIFGGLSQWDYVYFPELIPGERWHLSGYELPGPMGSGASITCDPVPTDAYLVVGGESDGFYFNNYPDFEEEIGGFQSQEVIPITQKAMISYHHN